MIDKETIGVAFLGVGRMGETHLRNITAISGVKVIAVADLIPERAERGRVMAGAELAMNEAVGSFWTCPCMTLTWLDS